MEIKFRGKSKLNGNWHFGSYINFGDDWCQIIPTKGHDDGNPYNSIRVISETVGQYVGLKDGNGIDIFVGDILKLKWGEDYKLETVGNVFYKESLATYVIDDRKRDDIHLFHKHVSYEIVGNIYDNPQLLEAS